MILKKITAASISGCALIAFAGSAQALTMTTPSCGAGRVTSSITCSGSWAGNDSNQQTGPNGVLAQLASDFSSNTGAGVWSTLNSNKSDSSGFGAFTSNPGDPSGILKFDTDQTGFFSVALKAGNQFSLYLFDGGISGLSSFEFNTLGTNVNSNNGKGRGLSHASLYTFTGATPPPQAVPAPAAVLPALFGMGMAAVRKKKSAPEEVA